MGPLHPSDVSMFAFDHSITMRTVDGEHLPAIAFLQALRMHIAAKPKTMMHEDTCPHFDQLLHIYTYIHIYAQTHTHIIS